MKVLWFSNCRLSDKNPKSTGSWLYSMAYSLAENGLELYNITTGSVVETTFFSNNYLKEWVLPTCSLSNDFLPPKRIIKSIQTLVSQIEPQIIHIWGMEGYWCRLSLKGFIKGPILLEMQGLLSSCAENFYGGLTEKERRKCYRLKEIISYKHSLPYQKKILELRGEQEADILSFHKYISTQSDWIRSRIMPFVSESCRVYNTDIAVRKCFLQSDPWKQPNYEKPIILSITSGAITYKGLHVAIKALQIIKKKYKDVELRIVGDYYQHAPSWRKPGYVKYLEELIEQFGLKENVKFLGPLDAGQIVTELLNSNLFLQNSFVESYSLTVAEALTLGVPCVISYAGAMPELAKDGETALFFNPNDYYKCAFQIMQLLSDDIMANRISSSATVMARNRHTNERVCKIQLDIYKEFLSDILYEKKQF